jgi:hypothetical protein
MSATNKTIPCHTVGEWTFHSERDYAEPFADVVVDVTFAGPSGETYACPACSTVG